MAGVIPTISSGVAGPLGVLHLPRFWSKVTLDAVGQLHSDYPACGAGFDQMVLDGLGLDKDATLAYISDNRPSYTEFEGWILEQKGGSLDQAAVDGAIMKMMPEEKLNVLVEIRGKRMTVVLQWHDQVTAMMDTELTDTES